MFSPVPCEIRSAARARAVLESPDTSDPWSRGVTDGSSLLASTAQSGDWADGYTDAVTERRVRENDSSGRRPVDRAGPLHGACAGNRLVRNHMTTPTRAKPHDETDSCETDSCCPPLSFWPRPHVGPIGPAFSPLHPTRAAPQACRAAAPALGPAAKPLPA